MRPTVPAAAFRRLSVLPSGRVQCRSSVGSPVRATVRPLPAHGSNATCRDVSGRKTSNAMRLTGSSGSLRVFTVIASSGPEVRYRDHLPMTSHRNGHHLRRDRASRGVHGRTETHPQERTGSARMLAYRRFGPSDVTTGSVRSHCGHAVGSTFLLFEYFGGCWNSRGIGAATVFKNLVVPCGKRAVTCAVLPSALRIDLPGPHMAHEGRSVGHDNPVRRRGGGTARRRSHSGLPVAAHSPSMWRSTRCRRCEAANGAHFVLKRPLVTSTTTSAP